MGDDLQQEVELGLILSAVQKLNVGATGQNQLVRIHGVMFPTIFVWPTRYQDTAYSYLALMRSLTRQNGGTFELLPHNQRRIIKYSSSDRYRWLIAASW